LHCHFDQMFEDDNQLGSIIQSRDMQFRLKRNI